MELTAGELRRVLLESLRLDPEDAQLAGVERIEDAVAMDSVALLQFVVELEARYGVSLGEEWLALDRLMDLPALAAHLREKVAGR